MTGQERKKSRGNPRNEKYKKILQSKIIYAKDKTKREKYEMEMITGCYMPTLIEGECPNCGIGLAIHDFCKELVCPVCSAVIEA